MNSRIALLVLVCAVYILPLHSARADTAASFSLTDVPTQLIPPSEDIAHLEDEANDDASEEKPYNIPMILNNSVENHLEYFQSRGRAVFQLWLDRSARYIPMMKEIFREKNLPEDLVYVAMIESGFNPYAVSGARAVGPWQFMAGTGKLYGLKIDWWIDERKDPVKSTIAAAEHLKDLLDLFGSWPMALASYNAGAGKVQRAVIRTRSEDFWDLKASKFIKKETKNYVPAFMAATIIAKNPAAYGFNAPEENPFTYDEVEIEESIDLRLVARCAECNYQDIKELNPELRRWITPPQVRSYVVKIPFGKKSVFLENYAAIPPDQKITWERHEVRKGETLATIAKRNHTTVGTLREINGLRKNRITPGKHLLIPINGSQDLTAMQPDQGLSLQKIVYRVRRGETLFKIAKKHNVTVADIREWNKSIGRSVQAGQKIKLVVDTDQI